MKKVRFIAGAAAVSLLLYETAETREHPKSLRAPYTAFDSRESTLVPTYHTHTEMTFDSLIDVTNTIVASGGNSGRESDRYRLQFVPAFARDENGEDKIVRIDLIGYSNTDQQHMYGKFDSLDDLSMLSDKLHLPTIQVEAIRRTLLAGSRTEVGGRIAALSFPEKSLRSIGLTFRPTL